jgi:hypothetical protein
LYEITGDIINRFDVNSGNYKFFKSGNKKEDYIFHTTKTINIDYELKKLNFIICDIEISKYLKRFFNDNWNVYYFNNIQPEKNIYQWIAEKCKSNNLSLEEKKRLFLNFINEDTKFDNITENILKNLELFRDINLNIKPLKVLIGNIITPSFLNTYKINQNEYFSELKPYIISESEDMFKVIYQQHQDEIINLLRSAEEIKSLIKLYQENKRYFFNEFIIIKEDDFFVINNKTNETFQVQSADKDARKFLDEYCSGNLFVLPNLFLEFKDEEGIKKAEDLHSLILEFVDADQHKEKIVDTKFHDEQLKKVRNLKPAGTKPVTKQNFIPKNNIMRKAGRGR